MRRLFFIVTLCFQLSGFGQTLDTAEGLATFYRRTDATTVTNIGLGFFAGTADTSVILTNSYSSPNPCSLLEIISAPYAQGVPTVTSLNQTWNLVASRTNFAGPTAHYYFLATNTTLAAGATITNTFASGSASYGALLTWVPVEYTALDQLAFLDAGLGHATDLEYGAVNTTNGAVRGVVYSGTSYSFASDFPVNTAATNAGGGVVYYLQSTNSTPAALTNYLTIASGGFVFASWISLKQASADTNIPINMLLTFEGGLNGGAVLTTTTVSNGAVNYDGWTFIYSESLPSVTNVFILSTNLQPRIPYSIGGTPYTGSGTNEMFLDYGHAKRDEGIQLTPPVSFSESNFTITAEMQFLTGATNTDTAGDLLGIWGGNYGYSEVVVTDSTNGNVVATSYSLGNTNQFWIQQINYINGGLYLGAHSAFNGVSQFGYRFGVATGKRYKVTLRAKGHNLTKPDYILIHNYAPAARPVGGIALDNIAFAWGALGNTPLDTITVPAPTNFFVQNGSNKVDVSATGLGLDYLLERWDAANGWTNLISNWRQWNNQVFHSDTTVVDGTTYQYRLTAFIGTNRSESATSGTVTINNNPGGWDVVVANPWATNGNNAGAINAYFDQSQTPFSQRLKAVLAPVSGIDFLVTEVTRTNGTTDIFRAVLSTNVNFAGIPWGYSGIRLIETTNGLYSWRFPNPITTSGDFYAGLVGDWTQIAVGVNDNQVGFTPYFPGGIYTNNVNALQMSFRLWLRITPVAPTNIIAAQTFTSEVTLNWSTNENPYSSFVIQQTNQGSGTFSPIYTNGMGIGTYVLTGLSTNVPYHWRVAAFADGYQTESITSYFTSGVTTLTNFDTSFKDATNTMLWVKFNGSTADSSTNNWSPVGTIAYTTGANGVANGAGSFNGSSAVINFGDILDMNGTQSFTLSAWVKYSDQAGYPYIIGKRAAGTVGWRMMNNSTVGADYGKMIGGLNDGTDSAVVSSTAALSDNAWHHVAVVVNRSTELLEVFVDKVSQGTISTSAVGTMANSDNLLIGDRYDGSVDNYFNGAIDDNRILPFAGDQRLINYLGNTNNVQ